MSGSSTSALSVNAAHKGSSTADDRVDVNHLILLLDLNIRPWVNFSPDAGTFKGCLESVLAFANIYPLFEAENHLTIIGCNSMTVQYISTSQDGVHGPSRQKQSPLEMKTALVNLVSTEGEDSLLAGGLTKSLCYVNRLEQDRAPAQTLHWRILIVSASAKASSQYMSYMNAFFSAQKQGVVIDACMIGQHSGLLQQACDITGGMYLRIERVQGLLQFLSWMYLGSVEERSMFILPPKAPVDYRAACFCHRNLIDVGYVCSICLSIFCKFSPICSTCHTVFKHLGPPPTLKMKAKKKVVKSS